MKPLIISFQYSLLYLIIGVVLETVLILINLSLAKYQLGKLAEEQNDPVVSHPDATEKARIIKGATTIRPTGL